MLKFKHSDGKEYDLGDYIKLLKAEGKDTAQIAAAVSLQDETKTIEDIIVDVRKQLKAIEVSEAVKAQDNATAKEIELKDSVKGLVTEEVKEQLKAMPAVKTEKREIKLFNVVTGKTLDYMKMNESHKAIADCLFYSMGNDQASVKAIQKDVDSEIKSQLETLGIKTALYSNTGSGAYTVPTEVSSDINVSTYNLSAMYRKANKQGILYNSKVYPVATDMTLATRTNENTAWSDVTPTLENPTITVEEYGGLALLSRRLVELRSPAVVQMLIAAAGSANARFIDTAAAAYSVTTDSAPFNGLIFDSLTGGVDDKALTAINEDDFIALIDGLSDNVDDITFIANRKVRMKYGVLETKTGGGKLFPDFMGNGLIAPMGYDFIENRKIPSTLTINASSGSANTRTGGTSDCLICADLSKLLIVTGMMRVDYSEHYKFAEDQVAWKFVNEIGVDILTDYGNVVTSVLELTN